MTDVYLYSARKLASDRLEKITSDLKEAQLLANGKACVYATGSFGRLEAGPNSDLDLFIIVDTEIVDDKKKKRLLKGTDEIKLKWHLIRVVEVNGIAEFDGDGKFLASHDIDSFTKWLGSNEDDYRNTLTGRMLMLLESKCLVGDDIYKKLISQVIEKYFRDYTGHEEDFTPSFLINDILRMWRTFCVNYEFYRKIGSPKNKIKNLKLKFSRMLTCYSGVIYLLAIHARSNTVRPSDIKNMIQLSPTERLEKIGSEKFWNGLTVRPDIESLVSKLIEKYSAFLELVHQNEEDAVRQYVLDEENWRARSYSFGQDLSKLIDIIGDVSSTADRLRRLIII